MTFNTRLNKIEFDLEFVLNLVINGWPSILKEKWKWKKYLITVLNLVINGWPSIRYVYT